MCSRRNMGQGYNQEQQNCSHKKPSCTTQCQGRELGDVGDTGLFTPVCHCKTLRSQGLLCPPEAMVLTGGKGKCVLSGSGSPFGCLGEMSLNTHSVYTALLSQGICAQTAELCVIYTSLSWFAGCFSLCPGPPEATSQTVWCGACLV